MLEELFGSKLRARVLERLFSRTDEHLFVRRLAALLGEDPANVSRELARLERMGLLVSTVEGRQKYYAADRDCPVFEDLRNLVTKTAGFADILREALRPLAPHIRAAFVYGSLASGKETPQSDVDLFVVGNASLRDLAPALRRASHALLREVNPFILSEGEFAAKIRARDHFVTAVLHSPKVFLIGGENDLKGPARQRVSGKA